MNTNYQQANSDLSFSEAIQFARKNKRFPIIADIKPASPRDGDLLGSRKPSDLACQLADAGVCALSVVTEPKNFNGSNELLRNVAKAISLPVLAKDFFTTPEQVRNACDAGARAILLIMATADDPLALQLYQTARTLDMEVVVEIHSQAELERAFRLNPTIIGINNRDILQLETDESDVRVTEKLAPLIPESIIRISESSLNTSEEVRRALNAGADAALIGTALLQTADISNCLKNLMGE